MMSLCSGKAWALPEQWSCDDIQVIKVKEFYEDDECTIYTKEYYGKSQGFSLNITLGGIKGYPYSVTQCGSAGCLGKITNIKTNQSKSFRFDCSLNDEEGKVLNCHMINCEHINATGIDKDFEDISNEYGDIFKK